MPPATLLHIEKTQWSPNCRIKSQGQGPSGQTFSGARSSTLWVLSLTLTCPCHPCPSLCFVLEEPTVSGAAPPPRVGSFEMQGKRHLCQLRPIVFAIPAEQYSRWAPNLCCGVCGVTKPGSSKIEAILGRHTMLLSCGKSALHSWLNLANSLMTKERPYVVRSSFGAIWTPQDWHEMVSASAGLSCITSHGVGIVGRIEVAGIVQGWRNGLQAGSWFAQRHRQVRGRSGIK